MTTALGCPSCGAPLQGGPACVACGLPLQGPLAARLWQVDQQLAALGAERVRILERLRAGDLGTAPVLMRPPGTPSAPLRAPHETSPERVQNTLLTLGAVLLALAGVVFAAVTYRQLGVVGRAAVLLALTAAAAAAPVALRRRGLTASAESIGGVALALAVLDAVSLRRAGIGDDLDGRTYWLVATLVLTALAGAWSQVLPLRVAQVATVVFAQLPVPLLLARLEPDAWVAAVALCAQASADLLIAGRTPLPRPQRVTALTAAAPLAFVALSVSLSAIDEDDRSGSVGVAAVAGVLALASYLARDALLRLLVALPVVPLLGGAALAAVRPELTTDQRPLVLVAVTLVSLQVAALLPDDRRVPAVASTAALAAITLLLEAQAVLEAVLGPLTWLADPWSRTATGARAALSPDVAWSGSVVTLVVLAGTAVAAVVGGVLLDRLRQVLPAAGVLVVLAAAALPLGLATSYRDALVLLLVVAAALGAGGLFAPGLAGPALLGSASAVALIASAWSLADEDATLVVLPVAAALLGALALRGGGALTAGGLLLAGGEVAAVAVSQDLAQDQVGGWLLAAAALPTALTFLLRGGHRYGAEVAAALLATTAVLLASVDPGWLSWALAGAGLLALADAVHADRRAVAVLGSLLLTGSSWVRLAEADVTAPEPYVAPVAAIALALGWLQRRTHPTLDTLSAYGPGLGVALVPTLIQSFADETPTRGVLLLLVAVLLVLVGAQTRTRAGLVVGGVVALVDGIQLTAPYAAALPRWLPLALLGLLLVTLGATYEQRLRDLKRLREGYERLT